MTRIKDYFKAKYDKKNSPAFLQGVLRTIAKLPEETLENKVLEK